MPNQTEPSVNVALAAHLSKRLGSWKVQAEHTGLLVDQLAWQVDILLTGPGRAPVAIEAEFEPARDVESEAVARLGKIVVAEPRPIEAAIALRYPKQLRTSHDLPSDVEDATLSWAVQYEDGGRFPEHGWLSGTSDDLADLLRIIATPGRDLDLATDTLQAGISYAATILDEVTRSQPALSGSIARLLGMKDVTQTRRMACAILANALIFHERIAGMHDGIQPLNLTCGPATPNAQGATLAAWDDILAIDYFPIFAIARDILSQLGAKAGSAVLMHLRTTAEMINSQGVASAHDLTGRIFQRLIADRKYLATFYTRPESAALLAQLAVSKIVDINWSDPNAIAKLRIGDFACGTGALLAAAYGAVAARAQFAGGGGGRSIE